MDKTWLFLGHPNCLEHWGRDVAASRDTAAFGPHGENFKSTQAYAPMCDPWYQNVYVASSAKLVGG